MGSGGLGIHNTVTKVLDPLKVVPKVFGTNDPLDLFGGKTKQFNDDVAKEKARILEENKNRKNIFSSMNTSLIDQNQTKTTLG